MRHILISLVLIFSLISFISADVIITQQPNEIYNLGDNLDIPIKITTLTDLGQIYGNGHINDIDSSIAELINSHQK